MMMSRNVPGWERSVRALLGIGVLAAAALGALGNGWMLWLAVAAGTTLVVTALAGFCPACAIEGRRP